MNASKNKIECHNSGIKEQEIERIALGIMITSTRDMRKRGVDIGKNGSPESLKVCNSIYLNAKKILISQLKK